MSLGHAGALLALLQLLLGLAVLGQVQSSNLLSLLDLLLVGLDLGLQIEFFSGVTVQRSIGIRQWTIN